MAVMLPPRLVSALSIAAKIYQRAYFDFQRRTAYEFHFDAREPRQGNSENEKMLTPEERATRACGERKTSQHPSIQGECSTVTLDVLESVKFDTE